MFLLKDLLTAYSSLWNDRHYNSNEDNILKELIKRELLDENSHPRVRKSPHQKFYLSMIRINESKLPSDVQTKLISEYISVMKELA
ncbi:hypothetical protein [Bacillus coahuilensis]|uniref:hypothetical protein n=1 Tax=Bacillus coahuilensis TaxID=408580 RepID=UPI003B42A586